MARAAASFLSLTILLFFYSSAAGSHIPGDNDNVIISSATEKYSFEYSRKRNTVEVEQEMNYTYLCQNYRDKAAFFEFFDNQTELDDVSLIENGKKASVSKELQQYSVEDIFYSDAKVYSLPLDFPKIGWKNEVRLKRTTIDPRYFTTIYFSDPYFTSSKEITITIPKWMKAEIREFNFDGYSISKTQDYSSKEEADIFTYTITDLPGRKQQPNQPGPSYFLPHLLILCKSASVDGNEFTFFNTLQDQYNWYRKITGLMNNNKEIIRAKATDIIKGVQDDMQKVKTVLYWVHDNIRYVAFEDGIAGFKPDEAQNVLSKKYGDCKGMANLTKELLVALGFDARLAWIGTNHIVYDYSTPALCVDNHMICCLVYKGKKYYLDGTESYLPLGEYAERLQGRQVLIEDGDHFMLEKIPLAQPEQNYCCFKENLKIAGNNLTGNIQYVFRGESKEHLLTTIHSLTNEKLSVYLERYITNDNNKYMISEVKTSDIDKTEGDFSISFKLDYAGAVSSFGNELYIDVDYNKIFNKASIDTANRHCDYQLDYKYDYNTEVNIEIPADYKVSSLPADFEYKHPDFYFSITHKVVGNTIQYRKQLKIINALLKKNVLVEWNKGIAGLSGKYLDQVVLVKK